MGEASHGHCAVVVRVARASDATEIASMVAAFVKEWRHPAADHPRSLDALREAYFGADPVAEMIVAERAGRVVGMGQWTRIYDMFWAMFGGVGEWLYVRPEARGLGVPAAILATMCERVREAGGEFLRGHESAQTTTLYQRSAIPQSPSIEFHLAGEAFQRLADLSGSPPREIVRRLPRPELNRPPEQRR